MLSRNNPGAAGNGPKEWRGYNLERVIIIAIDYMKQHFALPTEFADRRPIRDESPEGRDAGADGRRGGGLGERGGFGFGRGRGRGADRYEQLFWVKNISAKLIEVTLFQKDKIFVN